MPPSMYRRNELTGGALKIGLVTGSAPGPWALLFGAAKGHIKKERQWEFAPEAVSPLLQVPRPTLPAAAAAAGGVLVLGLLHALGCSHRS